MSHPERRQETGKINAAIPVIDVLDSQPVPELICEDSQDEHDNKNEGTEASSSKPVTTCIPDSLEIKQGNVRLEEQYDTDSEASTLSPKDHTEAGVIAEDKTPVALKLSQNLRRQDRSFRMICCLGGPGPSRVLQHLSSNFSDLIEGEMAYHRLVSIIGFWVIADHGIFTCIDNY